jgi:hypothetical protein
MNLSFTRWIKKQADRNDATGDIARDVKYDTCWPGSATTKRAFLNHLRYEHQACEAAIRAFENAYREWQHLVDGDSFEEEAGLRF